MYTKEDLIEEVRKYPCLYDIGDSKYSDTLKKEQAWKNIAKTLSQPDSVCKKMWQNLRECHRRAIKKKKRRSGQANWSSKKWKYEDEMSFLLPYYKERSSLTSVTDNEPVNDGDDEEDNSDFADMNEIVSNDNDNQNSTNRPSLDMLNRPESSASISASSSSNFPKNSKTFLKRKKKQENSSVSAVLMEYLLQEKTKKLDEDEIDKFFSTIATTVKKLSVYNQAVLKSKIFNMVSETEMQELQQKQNYYYGNDLFSSPSSTQDINARNPNTFTSSIEPKTEPPTMEVSVCDIPINAELP